MQFATNPRLRYIKIIHQARGLHSHEATILQFCIGHYFFKRFFYCGKWMHLNWNAIDGIRGMHKTLPRTANWKQQKTDATNNNCIKIIPCCSGESITIAYCRAYAPIFEWTKPCVVNWCTCKISLGISLSLALLHSLQSRGEWKRHKTTSD